MKLIYTLLLCSLLSWTLHAQSRNLRNTNQPSLIFQPTSSTLIVSPAKVSFIGRSQEIVIKDTTKDTKGNIIVELKGDVQVPTSLTVAVVPNAGTADAATYTLNPTPITFVPGGLHSFPIPFIIKPNGLSDSTIIVELRSGSTNIITDPNNILTIKIKRSKLSKPIVPVKQPGEIGFAKNEIKTEISSAVDTIRIPVELVLGKSEKLTEPISVTISILGGTAEAGKDYQFTNMPITFSPESLTKVELFFYKQNTATAGRIVNLKLTTKSPIKLGDTLLVVSFIEKPLPLNPYRLSVGSNFNLLDGVALQRLYADVSVFLPTAFGTFKRQGDQAGRPWGFEAGAYNNRTFLKPDVNPDDKTGQFIQLINRIGTDKAQIQRTKYVDSTTFTLDNLGFYFQPTIHLSGKSSSATKVYALAHLEVIRRIVTQVTHAEISKPISETVAYTQALIDTLRGVQRLPISGSFSRTNYDAYFAAGLLIHHLSKDVEFRIKGILGIGSLASASTIYNPKGTKGIFIVNFALMERNSGIKLGGEIRGYLDNSSPSFPYMYLAKEFSISRLLSFKGPFE